MRKIKLQKNIQNPRKNEKNSEEMKENAEKMAKTAFSIDFAQKILYTDISYN